MDWRTKCAAVIPCLNERATIGPLVKALSVQVASIYVVDDGSCDGTAQSAAAAGAHVLRHEVTLGKGAALRAAWQRVREAGFGWALTLDGDGQHAAEDVPAFLECAERTGAALVVGNRMGAAQSMPRVRRWVNRWMSARLSRLARRDLPDSQCGFRLMNLDAFAGVRIGASHFEIESEVLLAFVRHSYRVEFVPIRVIYKAEQSKIHPGRDTVRWLQWWYHARRSQGRTKIRPDH